MDNRSSSQHAAQQINDRLSQKATRVLDALRQALRRAEEELSGAPLVDASELPAGGGGGADLASLGRWVAAIDDDRNQVNILKSLLTAAHGYAARVSLFVVREDKATGWAAAGFTGCGSASDERVKSVAIPLSADTLLRHVASQGHGFVGAASAQRQNEMLLEALGSIEPMQIAAYPLINKGRVAAILYADSGNGSAGIASPEAIEILTRTATMSIELIPVRGKTAAPAAVAHPPTGATAAPQQAAPARPVAASAPQSPAAAAPVAASAPTPAAAPARPAGPDLSRLPPEEQKLHEAAKRFARLLVSEIKLYNEAKVVEGRKSKDLYNRLKEDIDRSKAMYQQRVNPKIAQSTTYFFDELVHALAAGDASALAGYQA